MSVDPAPSQGTPTTGSTPSRRRFPSKSLASTPLLRRSAYGSSSKLSRTSQPVARPDQKFAAGPLRDDIGRRAALLEKAVQPSAFLHLLAQQTDAVVGEDEGIQRVDAFLGVARGMRRAADELEVHVGHRQRPVEH